MSYFDGFVIPVPTANKQQQRSIRGPRNGNHAHLSIPHDHASNKQQPMHPHTNQRRTARQSNKPTQLRL